MQVGNLTRRNFTKTVAMGLPLLGATHLFAGEKSLARPGKGEKPDGSEKTEGGGAREWERFASPEEGGFDGARLRAVEEMLYALPTTSLIVVKSGKIAYSYGHTSQVSYLASVRKSILSMLYGKYVANGTIDLDRTMEDIGIDEPGGLLPIEKQATVRHLLMASSGVYYPASSPGGDESMPPRGSKKPGTHFLYNNWDFNVAGAIFEKLTGKTIFQALADDLAGPLEFQDYDPERQRMLGYEKPDGSRYPAYHMFLSCRDLARLGLVMINGGTWNGKQVIPADWIKESTKRRVDVPSADKKGISNYGYLWWLPKKTTPEWAGSFSAAGAFDQSLLCLPALDMVIVHRRAVTDEFAIARNLGRTKAIAAGGSVDVPKIAEAIIAARS